MPFTIPNTTSSNSYQRFGNGLYVGGWIQVMQQTGTTSTGGVYAFCTTKPGGPSGPIADQEITQLTPGWYPLQGSASNPIVSVSFKSAVANQPCQVFGIMYEANASGFGAGTSIASTINSTGSVSTGGNMITLKIVNNAISAGTGATLVHTGTGLYDITYSTSFATTPVVLVTVVGNGTLIAGHSPGSQTTTQVRLRDTAGTLTDADFDFVAVSVT